MLTVVNDDSEVQVPVWVTDLASFRRWADRDDFPEKGRICFLNDGVWIDMSKEQVFSHVEVKGEIGAVLSRLVKEAGLGMYFTDGVYWSNTTAKIGVKPDGLYVSRESVDRGRIQLVEGADGGYVEMEGIVDMVLEVVSQGSVRKDTVLLPKSYWKAGVKEYWLVDARREPLRFDILKRSGKRLAPTRKQAGWVPSEVFGKSFRLTRRTNQLGYPEHTLEVR